MYIKENVLIKYTDIKGTPITIVAWYVGVHTRVCVRVGVHVD